LKIIAYQHVVDSQMLNLWFIDPKGSIKRVLVEDVLYFKQSLKDLEVMHYGSNENIDSITATLIKTYI